ncbi:MAG: CRTAC1 family protein [Woeseiaceae bacterium]
MKNSTLGPFLLCLSACGGVDNLAPEPRFADVTADVGLRSEATWKYGGPTLADLNNDGRYDLAMTNHHEAPAQLFFATDDHRYVESDPIMHRDVHGIAAGDYDRDGLVDLIVSMGGGNGTTPQPPRLLRNTGGGFEDVTVAAGIADLGARGRSVRWIDLDSDGDLDLLEIVAQQLATETGPRNILFENLGDGTFKYRESPVFEDIEAERVLITDIDNDHIPDLVTFTPLSILKGDDNFGFTDVSAQWLTGLTEADREHAMAASEADIDNDGDMDLYIARGKTYYEIANNSLELDESGRMNLRDEGNAGHDHVEFTAGESVGLLDFWHWPRGVDLTLPVYLGDGREVLDTPTNEVPVNSFEAAGFPEVLDKNGWYLGYLGDGRWKLAWNLNDNLAWDLRASVTGVRRTHPAWEPQDLRVPDLLLVNEGGHYRNASDRLPVESGHNNWGVITADFDNDADADFFIWRFGQLHGRVADVLLINDSGSFTSSITHGATNLGGGGHGDMGAPLDYDGDGWVDILSGSDDAGYWNLFRNQGGKNNSITVRVGDSPNDTDAHGAEVTVTGNRVTDTQFRRVGSAGAVHSQGLNNLVHFGLGDKDSVSVKVRWRDGSEQILEDLPAGATHAFGQ